ncbi:hypothetical protein VTN77DRAFT_9780 [Rasamsonia byssochlamydoides]|uniref:uncharacterized protein n=1 Tax=Rasamsonia byssochlamydoides TaxID=89139 RepID=UPI0037422231
MGKKYSEGTWKEIVRTRKEAWKCCWYVVHVVFVQAQLCTLCMYFPTYVVNDLIYLSSISTSKRCGSIVIILVSLLLLSFFIDPRKATPAPLTNCICIYSYWNWSLDWEHLTKSPVWHIQDGFGGNGAVTGPESVAGGHCVLEGPFSDLDSAYYEGNYHPHCLSRGFQDEETVQRVGKITVLPAVLEQVFHELDYSDFLLKVEQVSHLTIPYVVRGDFAKITAPNGTFPTPALSMLNVTDLSLSPSSVTDLC